MKRSVALAVPSFDALARAGAAGERAGLHRAWTTELRARDAVVRAQHVAARTSTLRVGTGIAYAFTRHPLAMAAAAVEAGAATGGRLTVGVGAGTPHTRGEFGIAFDHPAPRLAEYLRLMRAAIDADGHLEFHGRFYRVRMPGFRFGQPAGLLRSLRLYGAALLPTALRALAGACDGIALHPFGHVDGYLDEVVLPVLRRAAGAADRPPPRIAAWMIACALDDADEARALARAQISLYAAQPGFAGYFDHTPWAAPAARIRAEVRLAAGAQPWREIGLRLVPDAMLDGLAAAGTPTAVAEAVAAKEAALGRRGVDELTLQVPGVALPQARTEAVLDGLISAVARESGPPARPDPAKVSPAKVSPAKVSPAKVSPAKVSADG
jgi:alkanesulfonate monooxygenase SsuD/methylene tetrahydromethanopterin reductase-like flavin-dependent oxidoreductase (luciferase family)